MADLDIDGMPADNLLPLDCWTCIVDFLDDGDVAWLRMTCRTLYYACGRAGKKGVWGPWSVVQSPARMAKMVRWANITEYDEMRFYGNTAAYRGALHTLIWLIGSTPLLTVECNQFLWNAAGGGHFDVMLWVYHNHRCKLTHKVFTAACHGGNLEAIKWLMEQKCPAAPDNAVEAAAKRKDLLLLATLDALGFPMTPAVFDLAIRTGDVSVVTWLGQVGCPMSQSTRDNATTIACMSGNNDMLQWAIQQGMPVTIHAMSAAVIGGYLDIVQHLRSIYPPVPWSTITSKHAVKRKDPEIAVYLYNNGCPFTANDLFNARQQWPDAPFRIRDIIEAAVGSHHLPHHPPFS